MKLDEIKLCEDGYYYDQFEKQFMTLAEVF